MASFMHKFGRSKSVVKRSKKHLEEALYKRLFKDGSSEISVRQQLNLFLKSKKKVYKWEVDDTLKILRSRNRFYPALKVSLITCYSFNTVFVFVCENMCISDFKD